MKNKITKLKNIIEDLDLITMDCFDNSYPNLGLKKELNR